MGNFREYNAFLNPMTVRKWIALFAAAALLFWGVAAALPHAHGTTNVCDVCHALVHAAAVLAAGWALHVMLVCLAERPRRAVGVRASFHLCSSPLRAPPAA